jgi:hypothetical protein
MSNIGIFSKLTTGAGQDHMVTQVATDVDYATCNLEICNPGNQDAQIKVAITSAAAPGAGDYVEFGASVPGDGGIYTRSCFLMGPGEKLFVNSSAAGLAVRLTGLSQPSST